MLIRLVGAPLGANELTGKKFAADAAPTMLIRLVGAPLGANKLSLAELTSGECCGDVGWSFPSQSPLKPKHP